MSRTGVALAGIVIMSAAMLAARGVPQGEDPAVLLRGAIEKEEVDGNLEAAIEQYKQVMRIAGANRAVAAQALLRLGGCYEKRGPQEARRTYVQLIRDYAEQAKEVAAARQRLAALATPAAAESGIVTRRIWSEPTTDFFGSVSPDGKHLSFVDWDTGDLAVRDLEGQSSRRITNKGSWESNPNDEAERSIWSPDSRQIAYQWSTAHGYELRLVRLGDPTARVLYRCTTVQEWIEPHDWSPDGKHILATLNRNDADAEMVLVSVSDATIRPLKKFSQSLSLTGAYISPDGRYVAYDYPKSESSSARDIFLLSIAGGRETLLIEHPADDFVLGWSPDGRWAIFASDRGGGVDVLAVQVEDGKPKDVPITVKRAVGRMVPLGLTRSGSFYFGVGGARNDVYAAALDPDTGKLLAPPTRLIKRSEGLNHSPQYSPDGKSIAYVSSGARPMAGAGWGDVLCVESLESGEEREYRREIARLGVRGFSRPRWSPDGQSMLLYGRDYRGRYGVYHLDLETGHAAGVVLSTQTLRVGIPVGWRDEKRFLYERRDMNNDRGEVRVTDLDNAVDELFVSFPVKGAIALSPNGRWLSAFESRGLNIISTDDVRMNRVFEFADSNAPTLQRHAWSADSKHVFYTRRIGVGVSFKFEVWRVATDGSQPVRTGLEMPGAIDNMSVHPDGKHLAFEHMSAMAESPAEVWVMENFLPKAK